MFNPISAPRFPRLALFLCGLAIALSAYAMPASAASYQVVLNGVNLALSQAPVQRGGRLFVPMRSIFQGLSAGVANDNGTINATAGTNTVQVKIGSNQAVVDGRQVFLDAPPFLENSIAMVPLRFVSEALGANVDYNNQTGAINIAAAKPAIPSGSIINATLDTALYTKNAYIGQPVTLTVSQNAQDAPSALAGATIYGKVVEAQAAAQGTNPSVQIAVDSIALANSSDPQPIAAKVLKVDPIQGSMIAKEAAGTLGGMLLGNWIGKAMDSNQGGLIGAVGGYMLTSNSKANITVPSGTPVTLELTDPLQIQ
ncbi:MAG TPA: copper amine oxidase N-terminal domain-containing protein [Candidatus Eremiobacteraceae bacterium]|nr:copper amine oxidase N-terminal domain-containing protein [Candidatus Eremiobacteraceae bacterium]